MKLKVDQFNNIFRLVMFVENMVAKLLSPRHSRIPSCWEAHLAWNYSKFIWKRVCPG